MKFLAAIFAAVSLSAASLQGAVLAKYTFDSSSRASSDTNAFTVSGSFNDGAGWTSTIDTTRGNTAPSVSVDSAQTTTPAGAIAANDYYSFNITPIAGVQMDLTGFTFDYANFSSTATFPVEGFFVRCSLDGFATNLTTDSATAASAGAFATDAFALTDPMFDNITTTVQFRIYVADNASNASVGALVDNIAVTGNVSAVPEPSSLILFGTSGCAFLFGWQRMRRRKF